MATSSPSSMPGRPSRRRQRSVRVTVAVALLALATVAVVLAVPTQSPMWLTFSSVFALASGWAAARIVYSELAQSRRDNARDRAAQAQAYREMFTVRATEHAVFTTAMTDRMKRTEAEVTDLQTSVVAAQRRAAEAEARVKREAQLAQAAQSKVVELEQRVQELEVTRAEQADQLASWDGFETVVDLMAWEEKVGAITKAAMPPEAKEA